MDKKKIRDYLSETFLAEEVTPGIAVTNKVKKESDKINKAGVADTEKRVKNYDKSQKAEASSTKQMPQNKFNYADDFQKEYHDEMEIMNGQEMIKYDSIPEKGYTDRAVEAIEGSSRMGNNPEWANVVPKQQGFTGPEFGKELVKKIKASAQKRGEQTPAVEMRGKDIQELPEKMRKDNGSKPIALSNGVTPGRKIKESLEINDNNKTKIKESMKRLIFKKEFKGLGNALKLIPEAYKVNEKVFEMTDGNETYKIRWEGTLSEGRAIIVTAADKNLVTEDISRMKALFGYKPESTLGLLKGKERVNEDKVFGDIWSKTKALMTESEDMEGATKPKEKPWEEEKKKAPEATKHIEGKTSTDKGTQAPKAKEGDPSKAVKQAPEAKKDIAGGSTSGKGTVTKPKEKHWEDVGGGEKMMEIEAPEATEGRWEDKKMPHAADAKKHIEGSVEGGDKMMTGFEGATKPKEGHWEDGKKGQASEASKHVSLKEGEEEEEMDIMKEEPMDENAMIEKSMKENEFGHEEETDTIEKDEEGGEEPADDSNWGKSDDLGGDDEKEPTAGDIKPEMPPMDATPSKVATGAKLMKSASNGEYWIENHGSKFKVPEKYEHIALNKSLGDGATRAGIIIAKMEAETPDVDGMDDELAEYAETHQNPSTGETHSTDPTAQTKMRRTLPSAASDKSTQADVKTGAPNIKRSGDENQLR